MDSKNNKENNIPAAPSADAGYIFPVGEYKGVAYFKPPVGHREDEALVRLRERREKINSQLRSLQIDMFPVKNPITVSFVYAHPADYYGIPMLNASVDDWKGHFRRFKKMHINTVIFQASLWRELNECYYQTKVFTDLKSFAVVEKMLQAAEEENIRVYMGGYGSVAGWRPSLTEEELKNEINCHRQCFEELSKLGKFHGMYFPSETSFKTQRLPEKERRMNYLYSKFTEMVKERNPGMQVIVSPATTHDPAHNSTFCDFWHAVLQDSGVDILMPQDCVGNGIVQLNWVPAQWEAWRSIADAHSMELWSHTEIFERVGYRPENNLRPADPELVAAQLAMTDPYVTCHSCWEALSFTADIHGERGRKLRFFMENGVLEDAK